jgi:hypothetical protein
MPLAGSGNIESLLKGETVMKKLFLVLALTFAFSACMTVVTVVAHTDQALADCGSSGC